MYIDKTKYFLTYFVFLAILNLIQLECNILYSAQILTHPNNNDISIIVYKYNIYK